MTQQNEKENAVCTERVLNYRSRSVIKGLTLPYPLTGGQGTKGNDVTVYNILPYGSRDNPMCSPFEPEASRGLIKTGAKVVKELCLVSRK